MSNSSEKEIYFFPDNQLTREFILKDAELSKREIEFEKQLVSQLIFKYRKWLKNSSRDINPNVTIHFSGFRSREKKIQATYKKNKVSKSEWRVSQRKQYEEPLVTEAIDTKENELQMAMVNQELISTEMSLTSECEESTVNVMSVEKGVVKLVSTSTNVVTFGEEFCQLIKDATYEEIKKEKKTLEDKLNDQIIENKKLIDKVFKLEINNNENNSKKKQEEKDTTKRTQNKEIQMSEEVKSSGSISNNSVNEDYKQLKLKLNAFFSKFYEHNHRDPTAVVSFVRTFPMLSSFFNEWLQIQGSGKLTSTSDKIK